MTYQLRIHQILETWIGELPVDSQTGAAIATRKEIEQLTQSLTLCFKGHLENQQTRWLSLLVQLYTQSVFKNQAPTCSSSIVDESGRTGKLPDVQIPTRETLLPTSKVQ